MSFVGGAKDPYQNVGRKKKINRIKKFHSTNKRFKTNINDDILMSKYTDVRQIKFINKKVGK